MGNANIYEKRKSSITTKSSYLNNTMLGLNIVLMTCKTEGDLRLIYNTGLTQ